MSYDQVRRQQVEFFEQLFREHRGTPFEVASETPAHKALRYTRLTQFMDPDGPFSVHDVGMGLAHYYEFLKNDPRTSHVQYSGTEIVSDYHDFCVKKYPGVPFFLRDLRDAPAGECYDYVVLSGVFHQMRENTRRQWEDYMFTLLAKAFAMSRRGMIFNVISEHVDFYRAEQYYADLTKVMHFIVDRLSRFFVTDHAYPLFEATFCVRQAEFIRQRFPEPEFQKYLR